MRIFQSYKRIEDGRGAFLGIINSGNWEEINYIETKAGQTRGGHYHKDTLELFFIVEGVIDVSVHDIDGNSRQSLTVMKGSILIIDPKEVHTFVCRTDSKWINVLSKRIDDQFHDIHCVEK